MRAPDIGRLAAVVVCLLAAAPAPAGQPAGAAPPPGTMHAFVGEVEFAGLRRYRTEQLAGLSGLAKGQRVTVDEVRDAARRLHETGLFASVLQKHFIQGDRIDVTFEVVESPWTMPVLFDNFVWFEDEELRRLVALDVPSFDGTAPPLGGVSEMIRASLQKLLHSRGIAGAVEHAQAMVPSGSAHLFTVRGADAPVCAVSFPGASPLFEADLTRASAILVGRSYSRHHLTEFARVSLRPLYEERGHMKARFGLPAVLTQRDPQCRKGISVTMPVDEGPLYAWGGIEWRGATQLAAPQLDELLGLGRDGAPGRSSLESGLKAVRQAYNKRGFLDAAFRIEPALQEEPRRAVWRIGVSEGERYMMGRLVLEGFSPKQAEAVRARWRLAEGQPYDPAYPADFVVDLIPRLRTLAPGRKSVSLGACPSIGSGRVAGAAAQNARSRDEGDRGGR